MKVKELLKDLNCANPEAELIFCTGDNGRNIEILSIYSPSGDETYKDGKYISSVNKKGKTVYIDLG